MTTPRSTVRRVTLQDSPRERFIVFFDILGWAAANKRAEGDPLRLDRLHAIVSVIKDMCEEFNRIRIKGRIIPDYAKPVGQVVLGHDLRSSWFSDSIILTSDASSAHLCTALALKISSMLLRLGFLCRGAMSLGPMIHSESACIGPALVAAYTCEQRVAHYPRIIADRSATDTLKRIEDRQETILNEVRNQPDLSSSSKGDLIAAQVTTATKTDSDGFIRLDPFSRIALLQADSHSRLLDRDLSPLTSIKVRAPMPNSVVDGIYSTMADRLASLAASTGRRIDIHQKYLWCLHCLAEHHVHTKASLNTLLESHRNAGDAQLDPLDWIRTPEELGGVKV